MRLNDLKKSVFIAGSLALTGVSLHFAFAQNGGSLPSDIGGTAGSAGQAAGQQAPATAATPVVTATPAATATPAPSASASAVPSSITVMTTTGSLGEYLVDSQGMSLYVFLADTQGQSNCSGSCAQAWPPFTVPSGMSVQGSGDVQNSMLGTIQRSDGSTQVTYAGRPLYYFSGDTAAGMTNGEGLNQFGALWYLVKPDGTDLVPSGG